MTGKMYQDWRENFAGVYQNVEGETRATILENTELRNSQLASEKENKAVRSAQPLRLTESN